MNVDSGKTLPLDELNKLVKEGKEKEEDWEDVSDLSVAEIAELQKPGMNRHQRRAAIKLARLAKGKK